MPYYKTAIGKTPFFTKNNFFIEHTNCKLLKKRLESADIVAVVKKIPYGCSIITSTSYLKVVCATSGRLSSR